MPELKSLTDFYNPMESGIKILSLQNQQDQVALHRQQVEQQGRNLEIDNVRQAYLTSNPMESYTAAKRMAELHGLPVPDVNKYYANTTMFDDLAKAAPGTPEYNQAFATLMQTDPRSRAAVEKEVMSQGAYRGAQNVNVAAGLGGDEDTARLTQTSSAAQSQLYNALAQDPLKQMQTQALRVKVQEAEATAANVNTQLAVLIPAKTELSLGLDRAAPHVESLNTIEQQYQKNLKSSGLEKASKLRMEQIAANPDLTKFQENRLQSIPKLEEHIQKLEDARAQLQTRAEMISQGIAPLKEGESLAILSGKADVASLQVEQAKAMLAFAKDPSPANQQALEVVRDTIESRVQSLTEKKSAAQDIAQSRLDETLRTNLVKERYANAVSKATQLFGALPKEQQNSQSASKIAQEVSRNFGVLVNTNDVLVKDPNKPPISVELKQANTISEGLGKQYLTLQEGSMSSSVKLAKLDRLDTMLGKIETGKFTPAMTEIQSAAESLGLSVDKSLPIKQAFEALSGEIALGLRNPSGGAGMPGALSDKDLSFLQSMTPSLAKTKDGNKLIIQTSKKLEQRSQVVARLAREYRASHGGNFDEGFYDVLQQYSEKHPLFTDADIGLVKQSSEPMPGPSYDAVKSGELYTAPDGSTRRKK